MNKGMLRRGSAAGTALVCALGVLLLSAPKVSAEGFSYGLRLCTGSVLPALFPFFVVCNLLTASPAAALLARPLRPLTRLCGAEETAAPLALALSWLGGYAVCARTLADLRTRGALSQESAARLLLLGICSGPGFVIGCLGGLMLGSVRIGVLLYGLQLAAALITAACLLPWRRPAAAACPPQPTRSPTVGLTRAIAAAVDSSLQVCGCTLFFCVLAAQLRRFLPAAVWAWPVLSAALEISTGASAFAALGGRWALYGLCACLSLPGLSVFCQVRVLYGPDAPMAALVLSRTVHFCWLQLLIRLTARFLPGAVAAFSSLRGRTILMERLPPDAAAVCLVFLCCALYKLRKNRYNKPDSTH